MLIRVNNKVKWRSQAGGVYRDKTGTVVARVNRGQDPAVVVDRLNQKYDFKISHPFSCPRDHNSFMVLVPGSNPHQKPTLYWPKLGDLTVV